MLEADKLLSPVYCSPIHTIHLLPGPPTPFTQISLNFKFGCSEFLDNFLKEKLKEVKINMSNNMYIK